jgi:hypothetical protein
MFQGNGRHRLYLRLGKSKRDRKLAAYIAADIEQGVNVSRLVKELLYNYYTGAPMSSYSGPVVPEQNEPSRQAALSSKLKKLTFGGLG